jgi:ABC-2 type transport system permease protein
VSVVAAARSQPEPQIRSSLWSDTLLLVGLRWRVAWNSFRARKTATQVLSVLGGAALFLLFAFLSAGAGTFAGVLLSRFPEMHLEAAIPGFILMAVVLLLLFGSFGTALGSLFFSSDIDLLMSAPVDRRAVFISKMLDGMAWNYVLILALAVPALITYGFGLEYGPLYYVLALVTVLGTPLLPAALGAILVLLVARFAPVRRLREVLGLMGALFGLTCGVLGQTGRFWIGALTRSNSRPDDFLRGLQNVVALPLPPFMAGRGLDAAGRGDITAALGNLSLFLALTFGVFALCVYAADYLYAVGWVRMQSSGSSNRSKARAARAAQRGGWLSRVPADVAIALKDWRVIPRDLRNFAQMLAPLIFWPIFYINVTAGAGGRSATANFLNDWSGVFAAAAILGSTVMLMGNLAFSSISREGKSWWLLKIAPISGFELMRGKFITVALPFVVVSTLGIVIAAIWRHFSLVWALYGWLSIEMLGLGMLAVAVCLAVPWAKLDWDDPRRMNSGWGGLITMLTWLLLGIIAGGFLCLPLLGEALNPPLTPLFAILAFVISTAITAASAYLAYKFGQSRIPEGS